MAILIIISRDVAFIYLTILVHKALNILADLIKVFSMSQL